jgi:uncharacterized repeat protein (TIGR04076 family)
MLRSVTSNQDKGVTMQEHQVKALVRQIVGITDEDWETLKQGSPGVYKFFTRIEDVGKSRIVAEVIESKYCAAGLKIGQKIVIEGGALVPEKSTAPLCMRAVGPLTGFVNTILEMIVAGEDPNDRVFQVAECLDPGIEAGGLGKVRFRVRVEPM